MNMQRRPQFQHYPLNQSQFISLANERQEVEKNISENLAQIRMLNNKMAKNDYEMSYLHRLQQRQRVLSNKKKQLDEILRTHQYLQDQLNQGKKNQIILRSGLANQYKSAMEEKKMRQEEERRRRIEEEQAMIQHSQRLQEIQQQKKRRQLLQLRKSAQDELAFRQTLRQKQKFYKEKEKEDFNNRVQYRNQLQTQKESAYKQYYSQFMDKQNRLQGIYDSTITPQVQEKQKTIQNFSQKQQQEYIRDQNRYHEQKVNKAAKDREMLRSYLQNQIQQKEKRKSMELEQRKSYHQQVAEYQSALKQKGDYQKYRRKSQQKRYDEELANQIKMKSSFNRDNDSQVQKVHNPITNPIDFKIGVTNPYVINQYQDTKQRYVGERDLKLRNLAMVGSNSLGH